MTVAICLQTCDRPTYTAETLRTLAEHNDMRRFVLLHGDDASQTPENRELAKAYGFKTVVKTKARAGYLPVRTALITKAAQQADWILLLENDCASVRPFPWDLFTFVAALPWAYTLRLFGAFKGPDGTEPCKTVSQWHPRKKAVKWKPLKKSPEPAEFGLIHWSAQPSVTRAQELVLLHRHGVKEQQRKTVRVVENVMVHIGAVRTRDLIQQVVAC